LTFSPTRIKFYQALVLCSGRIVGEDAVDGPAIRLWPERALTAAEAFAVEERRFSLNKDKPKKRRSIIRAVYGEDRVPVIPRRVDVSLLPEWNMDTAARQYRIYSTS